ncbi:MAG: hypothetical protein JSW10_07680 [Pseudomonadota bacterium]|nr:MAG: hypothetical protein JSW10_07680 [Pseudomonadota bacterium]
MTPELLQGVLGWATLINFGILLWWFAFIAFAHDLTYKLHSQWFNIPVDKFDAIHYSAMAVFKLGVVLFNLVPYLALRIVL